MKMTKFKKILSFTLCCVLIAAIALTASGCNGKEKESSKADTTISQLESGKIGTGKTQFKFTVTDAGGKETEFLINTDKTIVGEALQELKLISGDEGDFGLYVKTVNGITVDYDTDGNYWAFYENGKYAAKGADQTEIKPDTTYSFKVE